ncbi:MAG: indole-3-glycerol phosphate synthase TrpC [Candidatus Neomarinimicrobiota bacterium]
MNILQEIIAHKRDEIRRLATSRESSIPARRPDPVRDLRAALARPGMQVIAEIKRRSPSRGAIRPDLDPAELARCYQGAGAAAISVLTDSHYFGGSLEQLQTVRAAMDLPVLRKDFIIDPSQVYESAAAGADAILLIADCLLEEELARLYELARSLDLQVLVEGYSDASLAAISGLSPEIAGINSRNLETMEVDLDGMLPRRKLLPTGVIAVAESGIIDPAHLAAAARAGFKAALIGTALLIEGDPAANLRRLLAGRPQVEAAA